MSVEVTIPNNFIPRFYQREAMEFFDRGGKRAIDVWHRRAGKDIVAGHQTCKSAHRRVGAYWHFFPTLEQGRKAIWEGFTKDGRRTIDWIFPPEIVARRNEQQMMLELKCGSIWRLMGTDKIESVGAGPIGVVFSEFSLCRPSAWDLVRPMLRENGGWAWFIFTPRGSNHAKKLLDTNKGNPGWRTKVLTVHDTGLTYASESDPDRMLTPDEMISEELVSGMEEAMVNQEYRCDFSTANLGAIWGDLVTALEKAGAVHEFRAAGQRAFTTWDLGGSGASGDATTFWLWEPSPEGVDLLGYYENHGKTLEHYWDEVDRMCAEARVRPVKHWLPHDARAKHLTGVSVLEQCVSHWGVERVAIYPEDSLLNGIQAGRRLLQRRVRVHPRCSEGWEAIKAYHYAWDPDRKCFSNKPEHDWSSHGSDAFRGLALVVRHSEKLTRPEPPPKPESDPCFVERPRPAPRPLRPARPLTYDNAFNDNDRDERKRI